MAAPKHPNPPGWKSEKPWRDAIMIAVKREVARGANARRLSALADKLVAVALEGDIGALKEIGDRLDGKPTQGVNFAGQLEVGRIEREIIDAADTDRQNLPAATGAGALQGRVGRKG